MVECYIKIVKFLSKKEDRLPKTPTWTVVVYDLCIGSHWFCRLDFAALPRCEPCERRTVKCGCDASLTLPDTEKKKKSLQHFGKRTEKRLFWCFNETCYYFSFWKFLRPSPGERRSADMVVVKVIFSPYLRPTVKSPGDVGGPPTEPPRDGSQRRATSNVCAELLGPSCSTWIHSLRAGWLQWGESFSQFSREVVQL